MAQRPQILQCVHLANLTYLLLIHFAEATFEEGGEFDDEDLSELDVDMDEDDDSAEEVDIRALVGKGKKGDEPPAKKQRKA